MLLGTLGASLLGNMLAGREIKEYLELVMTIWSKTKIFNATKSFN